MPEDLTEKIKERILENLKRQRGKEEIPVPSQVMATPATKNSLGPLESALWRYGLRFASLIKKIPVLRHLSERVYFRLVRKQTMAPSLVPPVPDNSVTDTTNIYRILNYKAYLTMIEKEGIMGKIKKAVYGMVGFSPWWQNRINSELLRLIENSRNSLYHNDDDIRGMATLALEKIENYQGSLNDTTERIFDTVNKLRNNVRHLHEMDKEVIDNLGTSLEKSLNLANLALEKINSLYNNEDEIRGLATLALEKTEGLNRSDEEIRGLATLSLEKIENYQGSLNATAERIFE
ncbi:MAG: hypothetical protein AB1638_10320, partial [Nitrospirota bacterium]